MEQSEYLSLDALGMAQLVQDGEVTAAELMACARKLVREDGERINAVASVADDVGRQPDAGIFEGVPFLVKELLAYPGLKTTMGSRSPDMCRRNIRRTRGAWRLPVWRF